MKRPAVTQETGVTPRHDFIYLASQSPRRRQLLEQIGLRHELLLADASEDAEALEAETPGELPLAYVQRVTRAKLDAARLRWLQRGLPPAPILCADTIVALGRRIYGKPSDADDAAVTLQALSGRTHRVITAVAVAGVDSLSLWERAGVRAARTDSVDMRAPHPTLSPEGRGSHDGPVELLALSVSRVTFAALDADAIARYIASGEPFGKAGAYAIQGAAGAWVRRIDGSYSGIMGLPLFETAELLRAAGVRC